MLDFISNYWMVIIAGIVVILLAIFSIYTFIKLPKDEQLSKIQEWLLYAVVEAEHELGSGTGQIKLRLVYDMFIGKFPAVAKMLSFDGFSNLVDKALERMEQLIKSNQQVAEYVGKANKENDDSDV